MSIGERPPPRRLTDAQYRSVLDFVGEVHDAQDLTELRAMILPAVREMVPADFASYNELPRAGGEIVAVADPDLPRWAHEVWAEHGSSNPLAVHMTRTRDGRPLRFSDVISRREFHQTPLYAEFYRRIGVEHQIAFTLPSRNTLTIAIALSRGGTTDFAESDRTMLDLVRPHVIQAYRNAQLRQRSAGLLTALAEGMHEHGSAVVVTDERGVVVFATEEGRRLARRLDATPVVDGNALPPGVADGPAAGDDVLVKRIATGESTVVFLDRPSRVLGAGALEALGLTPREATALAWFARGLSTDATAERMGISPRTVLKHAERVHRKLGVRDRAHAVATAWAATEAGAT